VLAAIASQALHVDAREPAPSLRSLLTQIRTTFPPVNQPRPLSDDCDKLTETFARQVFD
jgi:hypothetical protein